MGRKDGGMGGAQVARRFGMHAGWGSISQEQWDERAKDDL